MPTAQIEESLAAAAAHLFSVIAAQRWADVAELADPNELAQLRDAVLRAADSWVRPLSSFPAVLTAVSAEPESERELTLARLERQRTDGLERLLSSLPGVRSVDDLRALAPTDLFIRWCQRWATTWRATPDGPPLPVDRHVLGVVLETPGRGHVVYSYTNPYKPEGTPRVALLLFIRVGDRWLLSNQQVDVGDLPLLDGRWADEFAYGVGFDL